MITTKNKEYCENIVKFYCVLKFFKLVLFFFRKKNSAIHTILSYKFHKKDFVTSCYWFSSKPTTDIIIFLSTINNLSHRLYCKFFVKNLCCGRKGNEVAT